MEPHERLAARLTTVETRLAVLERAVADLTRALPEATPGEKRTVFGIAVAVAPGVTEAQIRDAIAELPVGKDSEAVVDELVERGLVARLKGKGR